MIGLPIEELEEKITNYSAFNHVLIPSAVAKVINENNLKIEEDIANIIKEAIAKELEK